jgi:hypothetical protein
MPSVIQHYWSVYINIEANSAQELTPYIFKRKCNTDRKRKYFLSMPRFEPGSLGLTTHALANSAMLPLHQVTSAKSIHKSRELQNTKNVSKILLHSNLL